MCLHTKLSQEPVYTNPVQIARQTMDIPINKKGLSHRLATNDRFGADVHNGLKKKR
jgi:hypothetical protein